MIFIFEIQEAKLQYIVLTRKETVCRHDNRQLETGQLFN